jgi:hypothetical protein
MDEADLIFNEESFRSFEIKDIYKNTHESDLRKLKNLCESEKNKTHLNKYKNKNLGKNNSGNEIKKISDINNVFKNYEKDVISRLITLFPDKEEERKFQPFEINKENTEYFTNNFNFFNIDIEIFISILKNVLPKHVRKTKFSEYRDNLNAFCKYNTAKRIANYLLCTDHENELFCTLNILLNNFYCCK